MRDFFLLHHPLPGKLTAPSRQYAMSLYLATEHNCSPIRIEQFQNVHQPPFYDAMVSNHSKEKFEFKCLYQKVIIVIVRI